jgi:hypothetical protein
MPSLSAQKNAVQVSFLQHTVEALKYYGNQFMATDARYEAAGEVADFLRHQTFAHKVILAQLQWWNEVGGERNWLSNKQVNVIWMAISSLPINQIRLEDQLLVAMYDVLSRTSSK